MLSQRRATKTLLWSLIVCGAQVTSIRAEGSTSSGNVTEARVLAEAKSGENWFVNGASFDAQHFSPLHQLNVGNVNRLGLAWAAQLDSPIGLVAEPIVVDGVIYLSGPLSRVYAVDAASGKLLWQVSPTLNLAASVGSSYGARSNRGVAIWEGKVYVGTGDCRLLALDASSGKQLWESRVCDPITNPGSFISGAPRVGGGKVYIGYGASDFGARGSLVAFDARTGKEVWRFWTMPGDPRRPFESKALERAARTWTGSDWWKNGGGAVWEGITYDPITRLVYFGTDGGNPFDAKVRSPEGGDNLYLECVIAVNADKGEYVWHYQTVPWDTWDYNATNPIVVANVSIDRQLRRVVMTAAKDGFFYVLDARKGTLISAGAYAKVTWASRIDLLSGRPIEVPGARYGISASKHSIVWPSELGAHNWHAMSYDAVTGLVYLPVTDLPSTWQASMSEPLRVDLTSGFEPGTAVPPHTGRLLAWDPVQQRARWSAPRTLGINGGVLSTAGGLVFQGTATGEFEGYAANSGKLLWSVQTGAAIQAAPVSYRINGEQYVLIPVGLGGGFRLWDPQKASNLVTKRGITRLLAFKLGGSAPLEIAAYPTAVLPKPPTQTGTAAVIRRGAQLFYENCQVCHGPNAAGIDREALNGSVPDLRYASADVHRDWLAIVIGGARLPKGMPRFSLTAEEADAVHAYVIDRSWAAYRLVTGERN